MTKFEKGKYKGGYLHGGINRHFNLIPYKDNIVVPLKIQICVYNWYHTYLLPPALYRTETTIHQHLYCR